MDNYLHVMTGADAKAHQARRGSADAYAQISAEPAPSGLGAHEVEFLAARDSFYLASAGEDGWPYVQHRGGEAGFLHVIDRTHIAWAERSGNRQYLTAGNVDHDDRVSIIAVDYPHRQRIKLIGHARFDPSPSAEELAAVGFEGRNEGVVTVEVVAFEWNCPKYITPRFTADEVDAAVEPLRRRIAELEAALAGRP
ncbi:MAG: pyridoxamine 5-phosphate oxidase-related FMN-binding [Ilumatobacteraceae bacterium]|nr:pyridoxamine 5-phosphate oxidase-related FMN-binding [Ilumatobacteraceae bacterium]MCU1390732.1 pyridoxamine 5-phosphate oxidase-related FMN-binding [Ilumatobacteraceae bacterium]